MTPGYRIDEATGCWNFVGAIDTHGYGAVKKNGRQRGAHRVFYEELVGPIPLGYELDHLCRNRRCVNPEHLEPVTRAENARRAPQTKLNAEAVRTIRADATSTNALLAKQFGVDTSLISRVRRGEKHKESEQPATSKPATVSVLDNRLDHTTPCAKVALTEADLRLLAGVCGAAADELPKQWLDRQFLEGFAKRFARVADELREANRLRGGEAA